MTAGFGSPGDDPSGQGMVDPRVTPVGYPDEYRSLSANPTTGVSAAPAAVPASPATVARHETGEVAGTAVDAGARVAQSAKEQVGEVTREAGRQARDLVDQLLSEVSDQAATQQRRAADGLRSVADELSVMAGRAEQDGPITDLTRQAADKLQDVARWLENRNPGDVLDEVRTFARRRPGAYLALAAGAGVLAGRLTRGLTSQQDSPGPDHSGSARRVSGTTTSSPPLEAEALAGDQVWNPTAPQRSADWPTEPRLTGSAGDRRR